MPTLTVGLTGGVGAGKSTVAALFEALGVPVIDADQVARELVLPGNSAYHEIVAAFGTGILEAAGNAIDRRRLRERVFHDAGARARLEAILHPRIRTEMARRAAALRTPYYLRVVPLLVETGQTDAVDRVLVVDVPESVQIERTMARDGCSRETATAMLRSQASRERRLAAADDIIDNTGDPGTLAAAVRALHEGYLRLAASRAAGDLPAPRDR